MNELDLEKMKMDESDWYFSLLYRTYNPKGIPFAERYKEWTKITDEKKIVFLI